MLGDIPVQATVELGKTELSLKEILELSEGSIIELNRLAGEPLDLKVGGQLIAQGEVVAIDDYYGLRITTVAMKQ
jgi:flagellar motor switch protein FliN/FliY